MTAAGLAAAVTAATLTTFAPDARAEEVSPTGKGITGGALLGGEVVTITESLAGVHAGWAYVLGGGLGLVGGGIGGYFVEQSSSNGLGDAYMLAGGLGLVIPAIVLTLNATRYRPSDNATEDHPPAATPAADPGSVKGSVVAPPSSAPPSPPPTPPAATSLLDVRVVGQASDGFRLGVPVPSVRPVYSRRELADLGLSSQHQATEVRLPVLAVTF
jgi:MFS family permease